MTLCSACNAPIEGPGLVDPDRAWAFHPDCAVQRLPQDAVAAVGGLVLLALAPLLIVWAS
jgi:hypothetical protein